MAADPRQPSTTALAVRGGGALVAPTAAPSLPVQSAVGTMLAASVSAYGDVVAALLFDLDRISSDVADLGWLVGTRVAPDEQRTVQAALAQLRWWDGFLGELPNPALLSEARRAELERARALRHRARLVAREEALAEHRRRVEADLDDPDLDYDTYERLMRVRADPQPGEWRVDVDALVAEALSQLPPLPSVPPICGADLDPAHNFSGFNAVGAMRRHPALAERAARMDAAMAEALRAGLDLPPEEARRHGAALTDIFWIALRRSLAAGGHQLAASIQLLGAADQTPLQQQFARELLESWVVYLSEIPRPAPRPSLMQRMGLLTGSREPAALPVTEAPRQLEDKAAKPGLWARLTGKKGS